MSLNKWFEPKIIKTVLKFKKGKYEIQTVETVKLETSLVFFELRYKELAKRSNSFTLF